MEKLRQKQQERQDGEPLHCPVCMKKRPHSRRVSCGQEIFRCRKCGHEQSYQLKVMEVEE